MPHHGYMSTILEENKNAFDWLTRDIVNSAYCCFKRRDIVFQVILLQLQPVPWVCTTLVDTSFENFHHYTIHLDGVQIGHLSVQQPSRHVSFENQPSIQHQVNCLVL